MYKIHFKIVSENLCTNFLNGQPRCSLQNSIEQKISILLLTLYPLYQPGDFSCGLIVFVMLQSHSQFVESLLWPLVDGRYRAVVVEVVELLPDEELGVDGGGG